jgi:chromosome segregation ATPase
VMKIKQQVSNSLNLALDRMFPRIRSRHAFLHRRIDELLKENDELRSRIVVAQQERAVAGKQADLLRQEKERLRSRSRALKISVGEIKRKNEVLAAKITELQAANEALSAASLSPVVGVVPPSPDVAHQLP